MGCSYSGTVPDDIKKYWVRFVSLTIWAAEYIFFYPKLKRVLQTLPGLDPGSVIFDVGGNRGQSIKFFRKIFSDTKIYSFEPSPRIFRELQKYNSKDVQTENIGLSSENGFAIFHESILDEASTFDLPDLDSEWHRRKSKVLGMDRLKMYSEIQVPIRKIDSIVDENEVSNIFLLKIDVEGHELKVLIGARECLDKKLITNIQMERHLDDLRINDEAEIESYLSSFGFKKSSSIRHSIGNFYEDIFTLEQNV